MNKDYAGQASTFINAEAKRKAAQKKPDTKKADVKSEPIKTDSVPEYYVLKKEAKSKRVNLLIQPTLYGKLKSAADSAGISVNEYVNNIIRKEIEG